ncbi:protoporphyrinogen oxidase [Streptomyces sp. ME19-01-6]|uniref:protoporphyrinogen oxidase n=1 Tax=Streptomyces sp. ME19-01-6 TaxID=3028686 RepID=UPI0029A3488E|nr:protoporphyrinogen oxidase [Streptomyces sp. ME19-01-6]MDX3231430.1 protoporphyrinogen oxidase [Streptomyces sp. ME19-01-6]
MSAANGRTGHVVVVGGGISGLAAAYRLLTGGARVTVLEASGRLGGKLYAGEIAGVPVDLGAESMLARRPEAVDLARAVGLGDRLQPPATATASLWTRGGLRPMPKGHVMGVPGDPAPLAASGVVSAEGLARIAQEPQLPPAELGEDVALGEFVASRLGREVVDRLVEPLLGGVYAGDVYRTSMRAAVPTLFEAARAHGSLTEGARALAARAAAASAGPVFTGIDGGIGRLPLAVADAVRAAGGEIRTGEPVRELRPTAAPDSPYSPDGPGSSGSAGEGRAARWTVVTERGEALEADAVVLAAPAPVAARLLAADSPAASAELATVDYASMALITMAFRRADVAELAQGSGFLVPPVDGHTIKAATFSSRKWGWLGEADPDLFVLRTSIGRFADEADLSRDDEDLVSLSLADLGEAIGLAARPVATRVNRWEGGLPQYPVGHLGRVARIRAEVAKLPALRVCGAVYDGVGIPACVASARTAADELLEVLAATQARGAGRGE